MLIDSQGAYLHTTFTGVNGTWRLVGSEDNGSVMQTLDTFRSNTGQYTTHTREQILTWFKAKKIWL